MTNLTRYQLLTTVFVSLSLLMLLSNGVFLIVLAIVTAFLLAVFQNMVKDKSKIAGLVASVVLVWSIYRIVRDFFS